MLTTRAQLIDLINALNDLDNVQLRTCWGELKLIFHDKKLPLRKRDITGYLMDLLDKLES